MIVELSNGSKIKLEENFGDFGYVLAILLNGSDKEIFLKLNRDDVIKLRELLIGRNL